MQVSPRFKKDQEDFQHKIRIAKGANGISKEREGKGCWGRGRRGAGLSWGRRGVQLVRIPRPALENEFCLAKPQLKHT